MRDGRAESQEAEAYLKQYVEELSGEPACCQAFRGSKPRLQQKPFGLFIDQGVADQRHAKSGFRDSSKNSMAAFFDLEGQDT